MVILFPSTGYHLPLPLTNTQFSTPPGDLTWTGIWFTPLASTFRSFTRAVTSYDQDRRALPSSNSHAHGKTRNPRANSSKSLGLLSRETQPRSRIHNGCPEQGHRKRAWQKAGRTGVGTPGLSFKWPAPNYTFIRWLGGTGIPNFWVQSKMYMTSIR